MDALTRFETYGSVSVMSEREDAIRERAGRSPVFGGTVRLACPKRTAVRRQTAVESRFDCSHPARIFCPFFCFWLTNFDAGDMTLSVGLLKLRARPG